MCQPCASGCDVCMTTDLTECTVCSVGHYIKKDINGVSRCEHCFENC